MFQLQDSAYAGLRAATANVAIFAGLFAVYAMSLGQADGPRLPPTLLCLLAGPVGGAYYLLRSRPKPARYTLFAGSVLVIVGVTWLVMAAPPSV